MTSRAKKKIPLGKSEMKKRFRALPGPQNLHFDDFLMIFLKFLASFFQGKRDGLTRVFFLFRAARETSEHECKS